MIDQYRSHPSIIIWSIGNEFDSDSPLGARYVEQAAGFVRQKDPTRLVTYASDRHRPGKKPDLGFRHVDVISVNEYYGWYYGTINDIGARLDAIHQKHPDKPILVSEFGSGTPLDVRAEGQLPIEGKNFNVDYQKAFLGAHIEQIFDEKRRGYVAGGLIWLYNDFNDPHRDERDHPQNLRFVNLKGLVTRDRQPKPAFETVRQLYLNMR